MAVNSDGFNPGQDIHPFVGFEKLSPEFESSVEW
jgi:hypothetical protein